MTIKDSEPDYLNETEADLRARIVQYLQWAQLQTLAYDALRSHGVDYKSLPEYKDDAAITGAYRLKPIKASEITINWMMRLEHAIRAAIRRKQLVGLKGGVPPKTPTKS